MNTLNLQVSFRPLKFGWCILKDDYEGLRKAMLLTHTLWGGRYNPIIVVDDRGSTHMVENYRVDALYQISPDSRVKKFIDEFKHLIWPSIHNNFYLTDSPRKYSNYVDLFHPINLIYKEYVKNIHEPKFKLTLIEWDENDPLSDVLLATVGKTKVTEYIAKDYLEMIEAKLPVETRTLDSKDNLAPDLFERNTINTLTTYSLSSRYGNSRKSGFYYGDANSFTDIVNFWNLRACDSNVIFYDKNHTTRLDELRDRFVQNIKKQFEIESYLVRDKITVWRGLDIRENFEEIFKTKTTVSVWDFDKTSISPVPLNTGYKAILGSIDDNLEKPAVTFQLNDTLFSDEEYEFTQSYIVSINILTDFDTRQIKDYTFFIPKLPILNEFFARRCFSDYSRLRVSIEGIDIIVNVTTQTMSIYALKRSELFSRIFEAYGFLTEVTVPNLKAVRIIKQMNGIQGCRVFKIRGVRELLDKTKPLESFQTTYAINMIGQMDSTNKPQFEDFENLFIESRKERKLKPHDVLKYLTEKGVFRVGLKLKCPNCQLEPWLHIDQLNTYSICEYCGYEFNITRQLRDRNWFYRASSLFSSKDEQSGIIPVILTLQQLDTTEFSRFKTFSTGLKIMPKTKDDFECEIDFIYLSQNQYGRLQLAIAECKTKGEITETDVLNLKVVADSFPPRMVDVFIIFSKLTSFTESEIAFCMKAQDKYRYRIIMLTNRELEPYDVLEKTKKEFNISNNAISLEDLARVTHEVYFKTRK